MDFNRRIKFNQLISNKQFHNKNKIQMKTDF